jgi:branched-chain amino acid transport system substrate-binding protein
MSDIDNGEQEVRTNASRRRVLKASALALATAGTYGAAPFFGPVEAHHAWAQSGQKKAARPRPHDGCERPVRGERNGRAPGRDDGDQGDSTPKAASWPPIEAIHMDSETTPATGSRVAERLITRNEAAFLIGALHSGVANAISQVAQKYGCIFLNTNSSSPTEAGKDCHRVKFVWDGNGTNFALAIVKNAMAVNGKNWVLLTNDYVWGHQTSKATRTIVEASGGKIVEELMVPQNTRDFSSYLLKIQQIKPNVVAAAIGGDDIKALRQQVVQVKLNKSPAWINNQQDWPDVYGLGPDAIFGVFGTNWYYRLDLPGVKEFVAAYQTTYPGVQIRVPGNTYYNGYMATRELLRAVERAGTTNNIRVIKELEALKVSARDRMQDFDAYMNPVTHQLQQTIYMATYNDAPAEKDDIFKILAKLPPKEVEDPEAPTTCKLESYEATPTYEM